MLQSGFSLVDCPAADQAELVQLLIHRALRVHPGKVLVYDASHAFSPDHFAATNRRAGRPEAEHADRCFVQRCMTPFQWDTMLSKHLDRFLAANPGNLALVVAFPYGRLFATDELAPWERIDHLEYSLAHLASRASTNAVPIVAVTDFPALQEQPDLLARLQAVPGTVRASRQKGTWTLAGPPGNVHLALSKPQVPTWHGLTSMGMSQPTVTAQIDAFAASFAPFRANLPRREQARFDELVVWARRHGNALNVSEDLDITRRILLVAALALADRTVTLAQQDTDLASRHDALATQVESRLRALEARLGIPTVESFQQTVPAAQETFHASTLPLRRLPESLVQHDGGLGQVAARDGPPPGAVPA